VYLLNFENISLLKSGTAIKSLNVVDNNNNNNNHHHHHCRRHDAHFYTAVGWLVLEWVTIRGYTILVFNKATQAYSAWPSLCG